MNWDAIGAIAELLGAVGMIASLVYLARQIGAGARASAVESKLASTRMLTEFNDELIRDPVLDELMNRGIRDFNALAPEEERRFTNMSLKAFWYFSAGFFQWRSGAISEDDWHELVAIIRFWVGGHGTRQWWGKMGQRMFRGEFVAFIESEIARFEAD